MKGVVQDVQGRATVFMRAISLDPEAEAATSGTSCLGANLDASAHSAMKLLREPPDGGVVVAAPLQGRSTTSDASSEVIFTGVLLAPSPCRRTRRCSGDHRFLVATPRAVFGGLPSGLCASRQTHRVARPSMSCTIFGGGGG